MYDQEQDVSILYISETGGTGDVVKSISICDIDWLTYRSYRAQRKYYGCSAELCAKGYYDHEIFEEIYLSEETNVSN